MVSPQERGARFQISGWTRPGEKSLLPVGRGILSRAKLLSASREGAPVCCIGLGWAEHDEPCVFQAIQGLHNRLSYLKAHRLRPFYGIAVINGRQNI